MPLVAQIFAGIAAALHVLFFYLESVVFTKNGTYKSFGLTTKEDAEIVKPMALNQGFYNLFLAIGIVVGLVLYHQDWNQQIQPYHPAGPHELEGQAVVIFALACMLGAALVLLVSTKGKLLRGVLIQGLAPLIALIAIAVA